MVIPRAPAFGDTRAWTHRYLFVDFVSAEEADRAVNATNGRRAWGVKIRVQHANGPSSSKADERDAWDREVMPLAREHQFEFNP